MIRKVSESIKVDKHFIWEDMCFNKGPLISPELFKKFLLSPYQRVIEVSRQCGIQIIDVDSDGKVDELLPLWLEAGVTMQHPMEVAAGMDVVKVKKQYGDRLVIRGGIDKRCIAEGFDAIDKELERIRPAYEMGGYIPCIDHNVPSDISWDNYRYYLEKRAQLVGK
jgi:uroporphyrinogen decarboxylase